MNMMGQIRKKVTPSSKVEAQKAAIAEEALELVRACISGYSEIKDAELGGSYPKGTWLPQKADVDIFVRLYTGTTKTRFVEVIKEVGFAALKKYKPYTRYSEHPYVEAYMDGTRVNVVPCYAVKEGEWKSAADRSPYHTRFMQDNLTEQIKCDVRVLKQFLMSNGLYGSEISKQGFSGYMTEVLVWNFKSFEGVVRAGAKMEPGQVIGTAAREFDTPVTITDPVDPMRNLAAAVSNENVGRFILVCRNYLKKPAASFFGVRKARAARELLENCIGVTFQYKPRSPDTIWGQLKRAALMMSTQLELAGFSVIRSAAHTDEAGRASLVFMLESTIISRHRLSSGPDYFSEDDSARFISLSSKDALAMWVDENKILKVERRPESDARRFLTSLLGGNLKRSGVPSGIKNDVKGGFSVLKPGKSSPKSLNAQFLELVSTDATIISSG